MPQGGDVSAEHSGSGYVEKDYQRDQNYISVRITADGRDGWPVEPGRYRLIAAAPARGPTASIIVRRLLGLEDVISMGLRGPTHDERSWTFDLDPGGRDPVLGIERIQDAYFARFPDYPRGITVPAIVDVPTRAGRHQRLPADHARPVHRVDRSTTGRRARPLPRARCATRSTTSSSAVFTEVNNGVYRCGFAGSQEAYDAAYDRLLTALDWLEERLADQRYLVGDTITEADVRLFTTLARFDAVYHGHFKCNRQQAHRDAGPVGLRARPVPDARVRRHHRLRRRSSSTTTSSTRTSTRPDRPAGPDTWDWLTPHGREALGGPAVRRRHAARTGPRRRRGRPGHGPGGIAHR